MSSRDGSHVNRVHGLEICEYGSYVWIFAYDELKMR